jgi:hypothetical protein
LEKKVADADIVFIGTVSQINVPDTRLIGSEHLALVHVDTILKGEPGKDVNILYGGGIYELAPLCCEANEIYLFFLRKDGRGIYETVSGPFGTYKIRQDRQSFDWQIKKP